jgi:hypothetical protein
MWTRKRLLDVLTDAVILVGVLGVLVGAFAVAWFPGFSMW